MAIAPLSIYERALLTNQFKILSMIDPANAGRHIVDAEIFENGYTGLYSEALQHISSEETSSEICTETHNILTMYRSISNGIATLTAPERAALNLDQIAFDGFDANNDPHYHFAVFMIEKQGKYEEHNANNMNSHSMASMIRYRNMLPVYRNFLDNHIYNFGSNELQQFINAV